MIEWLFEFSLHSTLWLGAAGGAVRLAPTLRPRTRETIWYTAIVASLVAPSVHALVPESVTSFWTLGIPGTWLPSLGAGGSPSADLFTSAGGSPSSELGGILLFAWLSVSGILILRYIARVELSRRELARQELDVDSPAGHILSALCAEAGLRRKPRLTESESLGSPIALGVGANAEICLPTRALYELSPDQLRATLGHEVAHHRRLDPLRLAALNLFQATFFHQPLLRLARRDLHLAAEEECDGWAAGQIGDRLVLARCLTHVAGWVLHNDRRLSAVGMTRGNSNLLRRVNRLVDGQPDPGPRGGFGRRLAPVLVLALSPWLAPTVATSSNLGGVDPRIGEPSEHIGATDEGGEEHRDGVGEHAGESGEEHADGIEPEADGEHSEQGRGPAGDEHRTP